MSCRPRLDAIRLSTRAEGLAPPSPPFGLNVWSPEAAALGLWLDATGSDLSEVRDIADQIAAASTLQPGVAIVVLGVAVRAPSGWRRVLGAQSVRVSRALRCSALLVRGYIGIGAADDKRAGGDVVWAWSSPPLEQG